jgi:hypothetical protein
MQKGQVSHFNLHIRWPEPIKGHIRSSQSIIKMFILITPVGHPQLLQTRPYLLANQQLHHHQRQHKPLIQAQTQMEITHLLDQHPEIA